MKTAWYWRIDRETYRSMEWNREPRNKPSYRQRILDKGAKARGKGQFLQQMELGKPKIHMQKNETGLLSNTIDKKLTQNISKS